MMERVSLSPEEKSLHISDTHGCGMESTWAVCTKPSGNTAQGLCNMAGNVYEWVADWYASYTPGAQIDPVGPEKGIGHVLRGGSWQDGAEFVRAANRHVIREAYRDYAVPSGHGFNLGFRCVVVP